ncbi:hypothetical protein [Klebsiella phage IME268]|uniref:Uncharacterized protein n=1 Tax=Klebsiella phage IME268 TaxID=2860375 RepID=A0AC61NLD7_9CAUD|nr:hypothetical protein [Klebsiella phage IME268]
MNKPKIILIPSVDSVVNTYAKFTKGKRYTATAFTKCSGEMLYRVSDDYGREYHVNPRSSQYLGGHRFDIEYQIEGCSKREMLAYDDSRTISIATAGIGGGFINRACIVDLIPSDNNTKGDDTDPLLKAVVRAGIGWALSDATCESFMREPFSRIAELEKQVAFLTGELQEAIATIEKVREIMRTEPGYDVEDHARVLRMMADAFAKLQQ